MKKLRSTIRRIPLGLRLSLSEKLSRPRLFELTFAMVTRVMEADGKVLPSELEAVKDFIRKFLGFAPEHRKLAFGFIKQTRTSDTPFAEFAAEYAKLVRKRRRVLVALLDILIGIAWADGNFSANEKKLIQSAVNIFGLDHSVIARLEASHRLRRAEAEKPRSPHTRRVRIRMQSWLKERRRR